MRPETSRAQQNMQLRSELRSLVPHKEAIAQTTRDMLSGEYSFPYLESDILDQQLHPSRIVKIFDEEGKKDRNATFAAVIHLATLSALEAKGDNPPYGILELQANNELRPFDPLKTAYPWSATENAMLKTLSHYINKEVESMADEAKTDPNAIRAKIYKNLDFWGQFERLHIKDGASNGQRIVAGAHAATTLMINTLRSIPILIRNDRNFEAFNTIDEEIEYYTLVARETKTFFGELTSFEINIFEEIREGIIGHNNTISSTNFILTECPYTSEIKKKLDFTPEMYRLTLDNISRNGFLSNALKNKVVTRCPGNITIAQGEENAVSTLWNWNIQTARDIWRQSLERKRSVQ